MQVTIELDEQLAAHVQLAAKELDLPIDEVIDSWVRAGWTDYLRRRVPQAEIIDAMDNRYD